MKSIPIILVCALSAMTMVSCTDININEFSYEPLSYIQYPAIEDDELMSHSDLCLADNGNILTYNTIYESMFWINELKLTYSVLYYITYEGNIKTLKSFEGEDAPNIICMFFDTESELVWLSLKSSPFEQKEDSIYEVACLNLDGELLFTKDITMPVTSFEMFNDRILAISQTYTLEESLSLGYEVNVNDLSHDYLLFDETGNMEFIKFPVDFDYMNKTTNGYMLTSYGRAYLIDNEQNVIKEYNYDAYNKGFCDITFSYGAKTLAFDVGTNFELKLIDSSGNIEKLGCIKEVLSNKDAHYRSMQLKDDLVYLLFSEYENDVTYIGDIIIVIDLIKNECLEYENANVEEVILAKLFFYESGELCVVKSINNEDVYYYKVALEDVVDVT